MLQALSSFLEFHPVFRREELRCFLAQDLGMAGSAASNRVQGCLTNLVAWGLARKIRNGVYVAMSVWQERPEWLGYAIASRITADAVLGFQAALWFHLGYPPPDRLHVLTSSLEEEFPHDEWTFVPIRSRTHHRPENGARDPVWVHPSTGTFLGFPQVIKATTIERTFVDILDGHARRPREDRATTDDQKAKAPIPATWPSPTYQSCWEELAKIAPDLDMEAICNQPRSRTTTAKIGAFLMFYGNRREKDLALLKELPKRPHYWAKGMKGVLFRRWRLIVPDALVPDAWSPTHGSDLSRSRLKPTLSIQELGLELTLRRELHRRLEIRHFKEFKKGQLPLIRAVLAGRDAVGIMPTSAGKSLTFQFPSVLLNGPTLVISPLISLMEDQVKEAKNLGLKAFSIHGDQKKQAFGEVMEALESETLSLLFVSPESAMGILDELPLLRAHLAQIVVDEAHLITTWGGNFRPAYQALGSLRKRFPNVPILALTATATREGRLAIAHSLQLREGMEIQKLPIRRPDLFLSRKSTDGDFEAKYAALRAFIAPRKHEPGIVYCHRQDVTEQIARRLKHDLSIETQAYHAGLAPETRNTTQSAFLENRLNLIVATVAFGMGVNKGNIRWVVHFGPPPSLANYVQEVGRAGRDGNGAECLLIHSESDWIAWEKRLNPERREWLKHGRLRTKNPNPHSLKGQKHSHDLRRMRDFARGRACLHWIIDDLFFDEEFDPIPATSCQDGCDQCCSIERRNRILKEQMAAEDPGPPVIQPGPLIME